jgi:3'-phosphoadenosine 5'-phosphosulfate sulfotransferase (PAPS reductase)/FAD synthetase
MGQDSSTITDKLISDPVFRARYAPNDLVVIFSETGDEHDETYDHLEYTRELCKTNDIPFFHITPDLGYHSASWQSLNHFYDTKKAVGSKAFPKTCTDKLKLVPIYKFLEDYLGTTYQVETGRKKGFKEFLAKYGKIRVLIGIAKGEEKRMADPEKETKVWKRDSIEVVYPLVDIGYGRQECQDYLRAEGKPVPMPSNCRRCPFMSEQELLWMHRFIPDVYNDWVRQEAVKMAANLHMEDRNLGVWGKKTLPEVLEVAKKKYGHWTDEQLQDYKMSHGHCVASKY